MGRPRDAEVPLARIDPPWSKGSGLEAVLERWRTDHRVWPNMVLEHAVPARLGFTSSIPDTVPQRVRRALEARGVRALFSHQARAYELACAGRDVVVATPTASGKSLCFNLPVVSRFASDVDERALYLFPTKALSRDQEESLRALMRDAELPHGAITYDGDTPGDARRAARDRSGVLLTNPDMLHTGILPHHASWARLFSNLRYVVLDELHSYRGVFGSHLANVLRRLDRVARFHGSTPVYLFASATIGNPAEHAERMAGRPVALVDENGAPAGERRVMIYNPPVLNPELGVRESYIKATARLAADLVRANVSTLVFGQSRNSVEVILKYLRDQLAPDRIDPSLIQGYRGGYLPQTRRGIEGAMRGGSIRCVVATNALELGIDIGSLDAVVCAGYPGTIAGLMQRFGRAGRRGEMSLSLMVASSAPLDQFVASAPELLTGGSAEEARIDPDNVEILVQHLKCASFELPFEEGERFRDVRAEETAQALGYLAEHRVVHASTAPSGRSVFHWAADAYPANHVSLRSVGWDNFVIIDVDGNRSIAEMDWRSTHTMLHEQAIYQQDGEQYQVERLDYDNHKAFVRKVAPDYFTTAMTYTKVTVLEEERRRDLGTSPLWMGMGEVSVVEKVVGYKKIKFHTHENVGYGEVKLPEMQMHTQAFWLTAPEAWVQSHALARPLVIDALRGLLNAMHTAACAGLMIDPRDLGRTVGGWSGPDAAPQGRAGGDEADFNPTLFLYDAIPGGVGLAPRLFQSGEDLVVRADRLVAACSCASGCPGCIGPLAGGAPLNDVSARKRHVLSLASAMAVC